jgi:hypothetical protein
MAHFAEIDQNNTVLRVLVVDNSLEDRGADFLANDLGLGGTWIQTSYNGKIRYNFAAIDYTYDPDADAFIAPKPICGHPELTLNTSNYCWQCKNPEHNIEL